MLIDRDQENSRVAQSASADDFQLVASDIGHPSTSSARPAESEHHAIEALSASPSTHSSPTMVAPEGASADAASVVSASSSDAGGGSVGGILDDEATILGLRGPVSSLCRLLRMSRDRLGLTCHLRELNSRSYRTMRHCLYTSLLAMAVVLGILTHCFLWDTGSAVSPSAPRHITSNCGMILKLWGLISTGGFLYEIFFNQVAILRASIEHRIVGHSSFGCRHSAGCIALHHVLALLFAIIWLGVALAALRRFDLDQVRSLVLLVVFINAGVTVKCSRQYTMRLLRLELSARYAELRSLRERSIGDVLNISRLLEVTSDPAAVEGQADAVLDNQLVLAYDPTSFEEHGECCICSGDFDADGGEIRITRCQHVFHTECLGAWLHRSLSCPLCREDLTIGAQALPHQVNLTSMSEADVVRPSSRHELVQVLGATSNQRNLLAHPGGPS
eukprot:TRINITY_DN7121_c0_g1_i2.p1 TRINITY_DN7121_c0_g1~~TRINITY_DN7121_c0_g1_i2.p1  ORF type:complete len:446 (-),score=28.51 TRINITY_DN7121_c0_g1_i2:33-1370(-)